MDDSERCLVSFVCMGMWCCAMREKIILLLTVLICLFLTGCLYPKVEEAKHLPNEKQLEEVQEAVNHFYQENNGILPIKNKDDETDMFIKYIVDFKRIVPKYLSQIPENAYENGGVFQYVIINPDTNPTVKIFDLRIAEAIRDIKIRLQTKKYPPFQNVINQNAFTLDYSQLGYKEEPVIKSPYTGANLPLFITGEKEIYVDYTHDIYDFLQKGMFSGVKPGEDIRPLLAEQSIFVPAYSLPYTINQEGEPIFLTELKGDG